MISLPITTIIIVVISFCGTAVVCSQDVKINIPLSKQVTWANRELYNEFIYVNSSSKVEVKFSNISKNISFIIFQVHSHLYNVTVNNNTLMEGPNITGTNVGLHSYVNPIQMFYIVNPNTEILKVMISVHGYSSKDPIPGGCNMEFPISISPFIHSSLQKEVIFVDASPAMAYGDPQCIANKLDIFFYMLYLPERNFESTTYFEGIKKMLTLESIKENGVNIPNSKWPMRRKLSAYPGTGAIYVVVATAKDAPEYYSVYIPSHHYGCSLLKLETCDLIDDYLTELICTSLIFVGVLVCYFGHRFFKTEMFLFGLLSGFIITYVIISLISNLDQTALISGSLLSGLFFGAIWLTFWWYYGIPVIAVSLPALNMGFLISAIVYNKLPGDLIILQEDFNFWVIFILIMFLVCTILITVTFVSNILCCAVLGAFAVVFPMDFFLGSNVKYIIINTLRRAVVPRFNRVVLMVPFEWKDAVIVAFWTALALTGFLFQHYHNRGRPPFPPPPRSVRPGMPESGYGALPSRRRNVGPSVGVSRPVLDKTQDERTPLLG